MADVSAASCYVNSQAFFPKTDSLIPNKMTRLAKDQAAPLDSAIHELSLKGPNGTYAYERKPFAKGSVHWIHAGTSEKMESVVISIFKSWERPDGEPVGEYWSTRYGLDMITFKQLQTISGVVPLLDHIEIPCSDGFTQYTVAKRCDTDLETFWACSKKPLYHQAREILDLVKSAHDRKLVINDLKLSNILIGGQLYLGDLDLAFFAGTKSPKDDKTLGTIDFLPPESFCPDAPSDPFARDLWRLGIMLACLMDRTPKKKASVTLLRALNTLDANSIFSNQITSPMGTLSYSIELHRFHHIKELSYYIEAFERHLDSFIYASKKVGGLSPVVAKLLEANPKCRPKTIDEVIRLWEEHHPHHSDEESSSQSLTTSSEEDSPSDDDLLFGEELSSDSE